MILAVDSETTGTDFHHGCKPFLVTGCDGKNNYYWKGTVDPYNRLTVIWEEKELADLQTTLNLADTLIFHNAKFDLRALESIGIDLTNLWDKIEDTILASHALCSGESHALKYLSFKYMDYYNDDEQQLEQTVKGARILHKDYDIARLGHPTFPGIGGQKVSWWKMDYWLCPNECVAYGLGDVERTWGLWVKIFEEALYTHDLYEQYCTRKKLIRIAFDMETVGYNMYADEVRDEIAYLTDLRSSLQAKIKRDCKIGGDFDLTKETDLRFFLFEVLQITPYILSEKKGIPSVAKQAIEFMIQDNPNIPALQDFQEYRIAGTQIGYLSSYLKWVCPDGRIRANIFITGTRNTRQAYRDPNLQNIDRRLEQVFGPPEGYIWLDFDLVSIEPRIWAYLTGNRELIDILEAGKSPHNFFAEILYEKEWADCIASGIPFKEKYETTLYKWVKATDLAMMYGASAGKADATCHQDGAYNKIIGKMPELPTFNQECTNEVERNLDRYHAPWVTCMGGYKLDVPTEDIYVAPNTKIQGTAGWVIGLAMINVTSNPDYIINKCRIVVQVHDSLKIEIKESLYTDSLRLSLQESIESAGKSLLPTCTASYKIIRNTQVPF